MWRRVVFVVLFACALSVPVSAGIIFQGDPARQFLPLIRTGSSPLVEFVETSHLGCENGGCRVFGSSTWVYGYVKTTGTEPVYGVTLGVDVSTSSFCSPGSPCEPPSRTTVRATPAFAVTLPGQINPFGHTGTVAQITTDVHRVEWVSGRLAGAGDILAAPLTIVDWSKEGSRVSGTVRNDSASTLTQLRVVVADLTACSWKDTSLDVASLAPGATADFQLDYFCSGTDLTVVGQGVVRQ